MSGSLNKHAHILFRENDYKYLQKIARSQKKPMGELVRLAVHKIYGKAGENEKVASGRRLLERRDLKVADWEDMEKELMGRYG